MMLVESKLDQLHETKLLLIKFEADKNKLINEAIPLEVRQRISEIENEFQSVIDSAGSEIFRLENEIKDVVMVRGESVKGTNLQAIFIKGRQTWDNAELDKYAEKHPEILKFRKIGNPSVSIRIL